MIRRILDGVSIASTRQRHAGLGIDMCLVNAGRNIIDPAEHRDGDNSGDRLDRARCSSRVSKTNAESWPASSETQFESSPRSQSSSFMPICENQRRAVKIFRHG